ncbi:hypothetical protein EDD16DRAFT_1629112 [Pisolithus croceorrhizus]|nr:hypothetical protein EDD16DRAFT_1629112 [Pisolithus croceorrhizus]
MLQFSYGILTYSRAASVCRIADERPILESEIRSISQTLDADLLEHIMITFCEAYREHVLSIMATDQASHMKYDRQLNAPSMVQGIKALQVMLEVTKDEDEHRALEEDVTRKARTASSHYFSTPRMVHSLIDPAVLLAWDPRGSRRTVTKACGLRSGRRSYRGLRETFRG